MNKEYVQIDELIRRTKSIGFCHCFQVLFGAVKDAFMLSGGDDQLRERLGYFLVSTKRPKRTGELHELPRWSAQGPSLQYGGTGVGFEASFQGSDPEVCTASSECHIVLRT